jgi:hypothetical protein
MADYIEYDEVRIVKRDPDTGIEFVDSIRYPAGTKPVAATIQAEVDSRFTAWKGLISVPDSRTEREKIEDELVRLTEAKLAAEEQALKLDSEIITKQEELDKVDVKVVEDLK